MVKRQFLLVGVVGLALFLVQCKKPEPQAKGFQGVFTFTKGEVLKNGTSAKAGDRVLGADKVEVKEKSTAVIQFAADAQLTLGADTVIILDELAKGADGKVKININQQAGSSFSKVLAKGSDYKVSTPTLVAGVRGTSFSLTVDRSNPKKVVIKLLEGKLQATSTEPAKAGEPIMLEEGYKLEASDEKISAPVALSSSEKASLEQLNQIAMVNVAQLEEPKVAESGAVVPAVEIPNQVLENLTSEKPMAAEEPATATRKPEVKKMTLEELKKTYGRLSKVVTKSGKEYIGSFQQKDDFIIMTTVDGTVKIPVKEVAKISPFQG